MNNKIKFLGLMVLMLIATQAYGQKCKFDAQTTDPITGEEVKGNSFWIKGGSIRGGWALGLNKKDDQYFVGMYILLNGNVREIITPDNTIIFKLVNDELITINANEVFRPMQQANQYGIFSVFRAAYSISEADLQKMASSPLAHVRMNIGPRIFHESLKPKKAKEFQHQVRCILQ